MFFLNIQDQYNCYLFLCSQILSLLDFFPISSRQREINNCCIMIYLLNLDLVMLVLILILTGTQMRLLSKILLILSLKVVFLSEFYTDIVENLLDRHVSSKEKAFCISNQKYFVWFDFLLLKYH